MHTGNVQGFTHTKTAMQHWSIPLSHGDLSHRQEGTLAATSAQKQAWKDGITSLSSSIPQIQEIISGTKLPHVRDQGWDDGVIMKFKNKEDLQAYVIAAPHKAYQEATAEQTADKLIFDIKA
ncbi:uncharacterized protein FOMMEDRAFT_162260 [Fomitiporia mediterranea MF3/22]|uniref:uncharacterized protein n=1 Tax=Fomitiporia mediterranea (strain MF3/22) TaxID=694068 RepID=UPI00044097E7|nr:uncharacterized protein FOMMEDRAFT_162260 [Fomitiporia mediterranea MF3/22]EJC97915.1 hypothetical protein FOMMEDRAFT_162260 [Fomitiporia mediterranea MF3/22]